MKSLGLGIVAIIVMVLLFVTASSLFIVDQTEQALVLQFGRPVRVAQNPGLHMKMPFIQNVEYYDKRLLDFEAEPKEVIAADQKRLIVDAFLRYHIVDPLRFKQTVTDERTMRSRLNSILEASLRQALGNVSLSEIISGKRSELMTQIRNLVNEQVKGARTGKDSDKKIAPRGFGIEVVDVRIKRADLPPANSEGIYKRMQTERKKEANQFRAQGAEDAQKIRSEADKDRTIIIAEARKQADILRGEGDGEATRIFAGAFGKDQDFFQFYRTLQAYRKTLNGNDTTLVISPDNEFLKYMEKGAFTPAR